MANNHVKLNRGATFVPQASEPSNPTNGDMYYDDVLNKFRRFENGAFVDFISGQGGINYITNPDAEDAVTTGWNTYDDGAVSTPIDGTGGSPSVVTLITRDTFVIRGNHSFSIGKSASDGQGEGISTDFTIDRKDNVPEGQKLNVTFNYATASNYDDEIRIYIYDIDNATLIGEVVNGDIGELITTAGIDVTIHTFQGEFFTTDSLNYRLIFHIVSTNATSTSVEFDEVKVSPDVLVPGAIITEWEAFTPTGSWDTNVTYTGFKRRVGDSLEMQVRIDLDGAPNAVSLNVNLPNSLAIDTSKITDLTDTSMAVGIVHIEDEASTNFEGRATINSASVNSINCNFFLDSSTVETASVVNATSPQTWASGDALIMTAIVPIIGFSAGAIFSTTETLLKNQKTTIYMTAGSQAIGSTSPVKVDLDTVDLDVTGAFDSTLKRIVAQKDGEYLISAFASQGALTAGDDFNTEVFINGVSFQRYTNESSGTGFWTTGGTRIIGLSKGDFVELFVNSGADASYTIRGGIEDSFLSVAYLPDFSTFSVFGETELIESDVGFSAHGTVSQWTDVTSIPLSPGEWDLWGSVRYSNSAGTTTTQLEMGISEDSGNSFTDLNAPKNSNIIDPVGTAAFDDHQMNILVRGIIVTSDKTYFLKSRAFGSVANLDRSGHISARRVK